MITNTKIDLSNESKSRTDAINSIKYTLLLDYDVPKIDEETDDVEWVENVISACRKCCRRLFGAGGEAKSGPNFFGSAGRRVLMKEDDDSNSPLNYVEAEEKRYENQLKGQNLYDMILHQCVMSAYHAVLTALIGDETVSSYEIVKKIKTRKTEGDKRDSRGIHYLYEKKKYCLKEAKFTKDKKSCQTKSAAWTDESAYLKTKNSHLNNLARYRSLFEKNGEISLQFSDLWCRICEVDARNWNFDVENIDWMEKIKKIDGNLLKNKKNKSTDINLFGIGPDKVDGLYAYYLSERIFNTNLFYSMLEYIEYVEKKEQYNLSNKHMLNVLTKCKKLPNAFSRQLFLGYAFGKILDQPNSNVDYWYFKDIKKMDSFGHETRGINSGFQINTWIEQFQLFVDYMSEFIIPIYEWCFLGMLFETVEKMYDEKKYEPGISKEELHKEHLLRIYEMLSQYIKKHAIDMICPIRLSSATTPFKTENFSVLMKHSYDKRYDIQNGAIEQIVKRFMELNEGDHIELNLKLINPEFFINKIVNEKYYTERSNFQQIQVFYTDLIKRSYLTN